MSDAYERGFEIDTPPIHVKAGPQRVAAAFVPRFVGPVDDLMMPIDHTLVDMRIGTGFGITVGAAHPGSGDHRTDEGHRHLGHAEPPQGLRLPADGRRRGARLRHRHRAPAGHPGVPRPGQRRRHGRPDEVLRPGPHGRRLRERRPHGGAGHPGQSALPVPRRAAARGAGRQPPTASAISSWPRGCRSSSGARCPTPSSSRWRAAARSRPPPGSTGRCGGCWPTRRPRPCPPASARSGCGCRTSRRCGPTASSIPQWDQSLTDSMRQETELFFASLVREDRSVLDLLNADYTYVERAAGPALRLPQRHRHRVPPRARCRRPAAACSPRAAS